MAVDEMQHAMMRAAETKTRKSLIGIADEVAIGEKQELNEIVSGTRLVALAVAVASTQSGRRDVYVSHVDIFSVDC
jgi:hypothetical protein